jgi:hypothetical protein
MTPASVTRPSSSRYMSAEAASGAFSLKSSATRVSSAMRATRKPPPPMLPASGFTTARAKCVATAASTALPPACSMLSPAALARESVETTIPWTARSGASAGG